MCIAGRGNLTMGPATTSEFRPFRLWAAALRLHWAATLSFRV